VRALVVTSVHRADDPRIRERTVCSLAGAFEVRYATRAPGPSRGGDHEWAELKGGRLRRWWGALRQMCRSGVDVVSVHDPELIPAALLEALLGKGVASRLWALRSRHDLAYAFDAEYTALKQGSLLSIALKTSPARLEEARALLDALFADLRENGVSATEFSAAQAVAGTEFLKNCESKNQISTFAAHLEGLGLGAGFMDEFISRLQCLTLAEFNLYLKRVLQSQNRFDAAAGPGNE